MTATSLPPEGESAQWGIPPDLSTFLLFPGGFPANFLRGSLHPGMTRQGDQRQQLPQPKDVRAIFPRFPYENRMCSFIIMRVKTPLPPRCDERRRPRRGAPAADQGLLINLPDIAVDQRGRSSKTAPVLLKKVRRSAGIVP